MGDVRSTDDVTGQEQGHAGTSYGSPRDDGDGCDGRVAGAGLCRRWDGLGADLGGVGVPPSKPDQRLQRLRRWAPADRQEAGKTDERLFAVAAWREAPYFTDSERAALALTEAVTRLADSDDPVTDAVWSAAAGHFDQNQLAGLVLAIANINVWNRLNAATRQVAGSWQA